MCSCRPFIDFALIPLQKAFWPSALKLKMYFLLFLNVHRKMIFKSLGNVARLFLLSVTALLQR